MQDGGGEHVGGGVGVQLGVGEQLVRRRYQQPHPPDTISISLTLSSRIFYSFDVELIIQITKSNVATTLT